MTSFLVRSPARGSLFSLRSYSIGGQISFDLFPRDWDKTYCLCFVDSLSSRTSTSSETRPSSGGNDYEIFSCPRVNGYIVTSPEDTMEKCLNIIESL